MQNRLARIVSIVFHPLIMPPLGMLLLFNSGTYIDFLTYGQKRAIFLILLTGTTILPLSLAPVMLFQRMISNLRMDDHRERILPLLITVVFYIFTWYMLARINVPGLINTYAITASLTVLFCTLISLIWKISLHMTALGALAGMLLAISFRFGINLQLYLVIFFLISGITGWARLTLMAHTPAQIYTGYLGGVAIAFFLMFSF
jgi:hypothetical protein